MLSEEDKDDLYDAIVEGNRDGVVTVARKAVGSARTAVVRNICEWTLIVLLMTAE